MIRTGTIALLALLLAGGALAQSQAPKRPQKATKAGNPSAAKTQVEVPQPPPTPAQMPPVAPQVSYQGGQLAINAQNATLAEILANVRRQTGATVEVPGMASTERVFGKFGPGSPHDVLADLLDGSKFDFIVLAAPDRPEAIQYVKVTPKRGGPPTPPSAVAATRPMQPQPAPPGEDEILEEEIPDEGIVEEQPAEMEPQQPAPPGQVGPVQPGQPQPGQPAQPGQPGQEGVKSPEQLLQELQRLQQQQQQQIQEQLNPANRIPPNDPNTPNNPNDPNRNPPEGEQPE